MQWPAVLSIRSQRPSQGPPALDLGTSQPVSIGEAERFWKAYAHVHNAKRNRLDTERAVKLVRLHYHLRLRGRRRDAEAKAEHLPPMELNLEGLQAIETEADELVVNEE